MKKYKLEKDISDKEVKYNFANWLRELSDYINAHPEKIVEASIEYSNPGSGIEYISYKSGGFFVISIKMKG